MQLLSVSFTDASGQRSQEHPAIVLNTDPDHDLAVLKIEAPAEQLVPIRCALCKSLQSLISDPNCFLTAAFD